MPWCSPGPPKSRAFTRDLTAAQVDRASKQSVYDSVRSSKGEAAIIADDPLLAQSEGKTFASVNLAVALAQRGSRVLLVDADLRKPSVVRSLGLPDGEGSGLSSFLTGRHDIDRALRPFTAIPNLSVLPSGPIPPNPAELVSSPVMEELVREFRRRFEHIVLDSPPLLLVTDGILLSTLADGVVLVVESGATTRGALNRARRILDRAGANTLGAVLNKHPPTA
jgi:capsular exopolysaccharide synthesis family protein